MKVLFVPRRTEKLTSSKMGFIEPCSNEQCSNETTVSFLAISLGKSHCTTNENYVTASFVSKNSTLIYCKTEKRIANTIKVMRKKSINVQMIRETASFFCPSQYQRIGRPNRSDPTNATEKTSNEII